MSEQAGLTPRLEKYAPGVHNPRLARARRIIRGIASWEDRYLPDHAELIATIEMLRSMDCKIALMTGVWDLFHIGHARYMELGKIKAAECYSNDDQIIMVVGTDTDELTKARKGPKRPFVPQADRVDMLHHIRWVDLATLEVNRGELPMIIPHDVRIISETSNDVKNIEKHQRYCEHLVRLPPQSESSTTAMARRLILEGRGDVVTRVEQGLELLLREVRDGKVET